MYQHMTGLTIGAITALAALTGVGGATSGSTPVSASEHSAGPVRSWTDMKDGFWAVGSPGDSFKTQVLAVAQSKADRRDAIRGLTKMRVRAKHGSNLTLVGRGGPSSDLAGVNQTLRALKQGATTRDIPDHYHVRGDPHAHHRTWSFKTILVAKYCDESGCEQTDKITV